MVIATGNLQVDWKAWIIEAKNAIAPYPVNRLIPQTAHISPAFCCCIVILLLRFHLAYHVDLIAQF